MNYKTKIGLGLSALAFVLTGCIKQSGTIIDKRYEPERIYEKAVLVTGGRMSSTVQKQTMIDDEDYVIVVGWEVDKEALGKGRYKELVTRDLFVTKDVYDSLNVGEFFDGSKWPYETNDPDYSAKR